MLRGTERRSTVSCGPLKRLSLQMLGESVVAILQLRSNYPPNVLTKALKIRLKKRESPFCHPYLLNLCA
jgi:hypothetical protein